MSHPDRPNREDALVNFLALGPGRSLPKLLEHYASAGIPVPSLRTLKSWSAADSWQARAKEHEAQVSAAVQAAAISGTAQGHLDLAADIHAASRTLIAAILTATQNATIKTMADVNTLADCVIKLSRHGLDIRRGQMPDPARIEEALRSMANGEKSAAVVELPSAARPQEQTKTLSILAQFDAITGAARDKPN